VACLSDFVTNRVAESHPCDPDGWQYVLTHGSVIRAVIDYVWKALQNRGKVILANLLDFQRADIKDFTGSVLTGQWGQTEACAKASMCAHGRYHEDFEFGIVEQNCPVSEGGRARAAVVCTGFACPEFPFIRNEVTDVGLWYSDNDRCPCGLQSSTLEMVLGRVED